MDSWEADCVSVLEYISRATEKSADIGMEEVQPADNNLRFTGSGAGLCIADYCTPVPVIGTDVKCSEVLTIFRRNEGIPCVVLSEREQPAGLLMRESFYRALAGRYAVELFYARPALAFADRSPLAVDTTGTPEELIRGALEREGERFYNCVIITDRGRCKGVVTVKNLLLMSGLLQAEADSEREHAVSESYGHISGMESSLQEAAAAAEMSQSECQQMKKWIEAGSGKLSEVQRSYTKVSERMLAQQAEVSELLRDVAGISALTREIGGIAETSGLLAMNATIEAAHAGEHGRGFQVVAGEVRLLAMQTRQLSANITTLLDHIRTLAAGAAGLAAAGVKELGDSAEDVEEAGLLFGSLQAAVEKVEEAGRTAARLTRKSAGQAIGVKVRLQEMGGKSGNLG